MKAVILTASTMKKEINGSVFSGKCVTAFDLDNNRIVRFVRNPQGAPMESPYCNWYHPLDIVDIKVFENCPLSCQTENVLADYPHARHCGVYSDGIVALFDRVRYATRFENSFMNDGSYKLSDIASFQHSLEIIRVSNMKISGKKCSFTYNGKRYQYMSITDAEYKLGEEQSKSIGDAILVISIPADNKDDLGYFKFVASIFPIQ